mgnify:CR=1 FL=1
MPDVIRVALVGYGYAGRTFHAPLISAVEGLRLYGVVTGAPDAVRRDWPEAHCFADLTTALADPAVDLVVLATPNAVHAAQAHAALAAGRHVVVDKPFTVTVAEAEAVTAHAEQAGRVLAIFHNRRWDSDFLTLRALLAEGALGEVTYLESRFDRHRPAVRDRWRERPGPGAGLWFDLGPHLLDQALLLFGPPDDLVADLARLREGAQVDDYFHVVLRYKRRRVVLHASTLVLANDTRFAVHGTRGSFVKEGVDPQEEALKAGRTPGDATWGVDARPGILTTMEGDAVVRHEVTPLPGDYRRFYAGVRDAILGRGGVPVSGRAGAEVMRWVARAMGNGTD